MRMFVAYLRSNSCTLVESLKKPSETMEDSRWPDLDSNWLRPTSKISWPLREPDRSRLTKIRVQCTYVTSAPITWPSSYSIKRLQAYLILPQSSEPSVPISRRQVVMMSYPNTRGFLSSHSASERRENIP